MKIQGYVPFFISAPNQPGQPFRKKHGIHYAFVRVGSQENHLESVEKNRERIEYREVDSCSDSSFLSCVKEGNMDYIKTVGRSKQVRVPIEKDSQGNDITVSRETFIKCGSVRKPKVSMGDGIKDDIQIVGLISDMIMSAKEMSDYKRAHWKIENNLHHVLDDDFREDKICAWKSIS